MEMPTLLIFVLGLIEQRGWDRVPEEHRLLYAIASFIVSLFILAAVFYVAGVIVVGRRRALFSDAIVISLLGTIVGIVLDFFFSPIIGAILSLLVWLLLIRHYYETGWLGALAVGILAVIVYVIVSLIVLFILALLLDFTFVFTEWLVLFLAL